MTKTAKQTIGLAALATAVLSLSALTAATSASAEPTGSTCSDCPFYRAEFSIENKTGRPFSYQFRWGDNQPWEAAAAVLADGHRKTLTYPIGANRHARIPTPSIRFIARYCGKLACKPWTWVTRTMHYNSVLVDPGYGTGASTRVRKPMRFQVTVMGGDFGEFNLDVVRK